MVKEKTTDDRSLWDKFWKDKDGKLAIWQFPNWPLTFWAIFMFIAITFHGTLSRTSSFIAFVALLIWSVMEIAKGDSYFRRLLGAIVLIAMMFNRFG